MATRNEYIHEESSVNNRLVKQIGQDASFDTIIVFLRQVVEKRLRKKSEYSTPPLKQQSQPGDLPYSRALIKTYEDLESPEQYVEKLLPADVVRFFSQIKELLGKKEISPEIELLDDLAIRYRLEEQTDIYISLESEIQLSYEFWSNDAVSIAEELLRGFEATSPESEDDEEKGGGDEPEKEPDKPPLPTPIPTAHKEAEGGDDSITSPPPKTDEPNLEEIQRALLGPNAERTIGSLTTISLNSVLLAYTSAEGLNGLTYDQLDPVLQQSLFNQVHAKIENFILGLSAEERAQLASQGEFALRAKLLRQVHFFLKTDPRARILLQTALETHSQQLRATGKEATKLADQLEVAANTPNYVDDQLEKQAKTEELLLEIRQAELNTLANSDNYQEIFAQSLRVILGLSNVGEAARARDALNNSIASLTLSNPLLSPRFIDYLSPSQLEFFLQTRVGEVSFFTAQNELDRERIRALKELIKQYWIIYRAKYLKKITQDEEEAAKANANYRHLEKDEAQEVYTKTFVATVQRQAQSVKDSADEDGGADKVLNELAQKDEPDRHKGTKSLYWSQLSEEKKRIYMRYVYGSGVNLADISEERAVAEFQYLKYLQALNEAITIRAVAQKVQIAQATELARAVELDLLLQEAAQIEVVQQNAEAIQKYQVLQTLSQTPIQARTQQEFGQNHLQARMSQAQQMGGALLDMGMDLAIEAGLDAATGGTYEAIKNIPIIGQLVDGLVKKIAKDAIKQRIEQIKKILQVIATAAIAILALLLALLAKVLPLLGIVAGGIAGFAVGGPVGAVVGATAGGLGGGVLAGKTRRWFEGGKKIAGNRAFQQSARQAGSNVKNVASDLAGHGRNALQSSSQQGLATTFETTTAQQTLLTNLASNPFAASIISTVSITVAGTAVVYMTIQAAFLANFPYTGVFIDPIAENESRYVQIEKTASVDCSETENNTCPDPKFPVKAEYRVEIRPKEDYILTITNITDEISVEHNKKHYQDNGQTVPLIDREPKTFDEFGVSSDDLTVNPDETLVLTYSEKFNKDYNHANIRNKITIEFNYSNSGGSGQDSASTFEVIRLGEYPKGRICWPVSGRITQGPYDSFSHSVCDAYDIAPSDGIAAVHPMYAVADGELCAGRLTAGGMSGLYDSVYGNHLSLQTEFDGETYVFIYGHLADGTAIVQDGCEQVSAGTIIGYMGNTGKSTGTHLHFERRGGYDNSYSLTRLLPGGDLVDKFPNNQYVTSCYEGGFDD